MLKNNLLQTHDQKKTRQLFRVSSCLIGTRDQFRIQMTFEILDSPFQE